MDQKKIGVLIATVRKEKGYTQKEIADKLELSEKTISKWECGNGLPEVSFMIPLCQILQISVTELLSGERMSFLELYRKVEDTMMGLTKELEVEQLKQRVYKLYGLEIGNVNFSNYGAGSLTYITTGQDGKYVVKYASQNGMNHPEIEPDLCAYLLQSNIPVCEFVPNKQGRALSIDENGRLFHVQHFISGHTYHYNEAPAWLMNESAIMLGKIHNCLEDYEPLPTGIGEDFFKYRTPQGTLVSYQNMLNNSDEIKASHVEDIRSNMEILERFPDYQFDLSKLTLRNTHGDYSINQLLCGENEINAVIDWTSACVHPAIWEIVRSYVYASPLCKNGEIDIVGLVNYVEQYMTYGTLNSYDLENMGKLFYYFTAVSNFYGQYYASMTRNREIYLKQAELSAKLMRWFDKNINKLTEAMLVLNKEG